MCGESQRRSCCGRITTVFLDVSSLNYVLFSHVQSLSKKNMNSDENNSFAGDITAFRRHWDLGQGALTLGNAEEPATLWLERGLGFVLKESFKVMCFCIAFCPIDIFRFPDRVQPLQGDMSVLTQAWCVLVKQSTWWTGAKLRDCWPTGLCWILGCFSK